MTKNIDQHIKEFMAEYSKNFTERYHKNEAPVSLQTLLRKALDEYGQQCRLDVVKGIAKEESWGRTTRDFYLKRIRR